MVHDSKVGSNKVYVRTKAALLFGPGSLNFVLYPFFVTPCTAAIFGRVIIGLSSCFAPCRTSTMIFYFGDTRKSAFGDSGKSSFRPVVADRTDSPEAPL